VVVDIDAAMTRMVEQLRPMLKRDPLMVGIHTGGVWVAERLHQLLEFKEPLGTLDISLLPRRLHAHRHEPAGPHLAPAGERGESACDPGG
jgi:pyrimidine operon attenuation protein/uracil phosphoribosyltransferase